eukprot:scaffold15271_cov110-Isochrysis_galbana.AAC.4
MPTPVETVNSRCRVSWAESVSMSRKRLKLPSSSTASAGCVHSAVRAGTEPSADGSATTAQKRTTGRQSDVHTADASAARCSPFATWREESGRTRFSASAPARSSAATHSQCASSTEY